MQRRDFLAGMTIAGCVGSSTVFAETDSPATKESGDKGQRGGNPVSVSTYSYWRYRDDSETAIDHCLELAARDGFDGVEILEKQMERKDPEYLRRLRRIALRNGLVLCGLSSHQGFVSPDPEVREQNIQTTIGSIELAYELGIPIVRINTGRWGTSGDFDTLMKQRGIETPLEGYTDTDAFPWVVESIEKCLPIAEKCGVILGLENHWGLARLPEGQLALVDAVHSPMFDVILDTGNFLEYPYEKIEQVSRRVVYMHAKTYHGGGTWYTLDLDYDRIAKIMHTAGYRGFVSLEYEGQEPAETAIPKSLALLRKAFRYTTTLAQS